MKAGDQEITYNGIPTKVRDIPGASTRALWGYGHGNTTRPVLPGTWPHTPDTCEQADDPDAVAWINAGQTLVCTGCGLDCT